MPSPRPAGWIDGDVPSKSTRSVALSSDTTFTLTALDANPASGERTGSKSVKVSPPREDHAASANCAGSFSLTSTVNVSALSVSNPRVRRAGQVTPTDLCVTPPGGTETCLKAGESASHRAPGERHLDLENESKIGRSGHAAPAIARRHRFRLPLRGLACFRIEQLRSLVDTVVVVMMENRSFEPPARFPQPRSLRCARRRERAASTQRPVRLGQRGRRGATSIHRRPRPTATCPAICRTHGRRSRPS